MDKRPRTESRWIFRLQLLLLSVFSLFAFAIVAWVFRLIYLSWVLQDVFSVSIGIALVAVPVFLFLLIIFNYTFWGLLRARDAQRSSTGT